MLPWAIWSKISDVANRWVISLCANSFIYLPTTSQGNTFRHFTKLKQSRARKPFLEMILQKFYFNCSLIIKTKSWLKSQLLIGKVIIFIPPNIVIRELWLIFFDYFVFNLDRNITYNIEFTTFKAVRYSYHQYYSRSKCFKINLNHRPAFILSTPY